MTDSILTVLIPAATQDLTTLETARDETPSPSTSDATYLRWIREASGQIAAYLGRVLGAEKVAETYRHVRAGYLKLSRYPVITIHSIVVDDTALGVDEYEVDAEAGMLYLISSDCRVHWGGSKIVVTYTGGYVLMDSLPFPIESACLSLLKYRTSASVRDPALKSIQVEGVGTKSYWVGSIGTMDSQSLPPEVAGMLDRFVERRS